MFLQGLIFGLGFFLALVVLWFLFCAFLVLTKKSKRPDKYEIYHEESIIALKERNQIGSRSLEYLVRIARAFEKFNQSMEEGENDEQKT